MACIVAQVPGEGYALKGRRMDKEYLKKQAEIARRERQVPFAIIVLLVLSFMMLCLAIVLLTEPDWVYQILQPYT